MPRRTEVPELLDLQGVILAPNKQRQRRVKRMSLWPPFISARKDGDAFVVRTSELPTVKSVANLYDFEVRHQRAPSGNPGERLVQLIKFPTDDATATDAGES